MIVILGCCDSVRSHAVVCFAAQLYVVSEPAYCHVVPVKAQPQCKLRHVLTYDLAHVW